MKSLAIADIVVAAAVAAVGVQCVVAMNQPAFAAEATVVAEAVGVEFDELSEIVCVVTVSAALVAAVVGIVAAVAAVAVVMTVFVVAVELLFYRPWKC